MKRGEIWSVCDTVKKHLLDGICIFEKVNSE